MPDRALLQGRGPSIASLETDGQMLQRVMPELMGMRNILAINDEAHHCYRARHGDGDEEGDLKGDDRKEAEKNREAARLWINGLEAVQRKLGLQRVADLSATPFFLRGSGYAEGTLFPWTMSDFSLMDAIECGIVKLPRVPVADNIPGADVPIFGRGEATSTGRTSARTCRGRGEARRARSIHCASRRSCRPPWSALYGHYDKTAEVWEQEGVPVPPCFIVVCNNTATSKLVYDYISGFERTNDAGLTTVENGRLPRFRNFEDGQRLPLPRTLLIDSEHQLRKSGDALRHQARRRKMAGDEIEQASAASASSAPARRQPAPRRSSPTCELLREVMNTVGKPGQVIGQDVRCVVSVSMLTERLGRSTPSPTSSACAPSARNSSASR